MSPNPEFRGAKMPDEPNSFANASFVADETETKQRPRLNTALSNTSLTPSNLIAEKKSSGTDDGGDALMDFDDLLPHIGEFGWYQQRLFLLMIPFAFFVAWVYFSQIFLTLVPQEYTCAIPELDSLLNDPLDR